jgi:hypothetical protein
MAMTAQEIAALTNARLLGKIAEESSEVIKAAMKMQAFGERPHFKGVDYDNVRDLCTEFGQLSQFMDEFRARFEGGEDDSAFEYEGLANGDRS